MHDQLVNGGPLKMPCVLDENTRYCLVIEAGRSLCSQDVFRFRSGTFEPHQKSRATRTYASAGGCRASSRMFRLLFFIPMSCVPVVLITPIIDRFCLEGGNGNAATTQPEGS